MGYFLVSLIPETKRPVFSFPKKILYICVICVFIFSFTPILNVVLLFYQSMGFLNVLKSVLFTFEIGRSWIASFILCGFLFLLLLNKKFYKAHYLTGIFLTVVLILSFGWASHATALSKFSGFITQSLHVLCVSIWIGVLFMVSWFSINEKNWLPFLKWFTPLAIGCFSIITVTGFYIMTLVIDFNNYTSSFLVSYGQALLIKHVLILPLLIFAFINGFLIRRKMIANNQYTPIPWARAETIIIFFIFSITAFLNQQSPPHNITSLIKREGISSLYTLFHRNEAVTNTQLLFHFAFNGALYLLSALLFCYTIYYLFQKGSVIFSLLISVFAAIAIYLSIMTSIM
jgi:putative copper resistance protein D